MFLLKALNGKEIPLKRASRILGVILGAFGVFLGGVELSGGESLP